MVHVASHVVALVRGQLDSLFSVIPVTTTVFSFLRSANFIGGCCYSTTPFYTVLIIITIITNIN